MFSNRVPHRSTLTRVPSNECYTFVVLIRNNNSNPAFGDAVLTANLLLVWIPLFALAEWISKPT